MDRERFDQIARLLGGRVSRRGGLSLLVATLVGAAAPDATDAKRRKAGCKAPKKRCGGKCVSVRNDRNNCGSCNRRCPSAQRCAAGRCSGGGGGGRGVGGDWPDAEEAAFDALINGHRAANNKPRLDLNPKLGEAAELHSQEQARRRKMTHDGADGSDAGERIGRAGYAWSAWGENVAYNSGDGSARAVFNAWKNSPGHNKNMLNTGFTQYGIGRARASNGAWYWTTTFGKPR